MGLNNETPVLAAQSSLATEPRRPRRRRREGPGAEQPPPLVYLPAGTRSKSVNKVR